MQQKYLPQHETQFGNHRKSILSGVHSGLQEIMPLTDTLAQ